MRYPQGSEELQARWGQLTRQSEHLIRGTYLWGNDLVASLVATSFCVFGSIAVCFMRASNRSSG